MDYSALINPIEHPLLLDPDFEDQEDGTDFQKIKLEDDLDDLSLNKNNTVPVSANTNNSTSNNGKNGGFFRRSKSKPEELKEELGSPSKKSNPIEIKGSPAHHKSNNKEKDPGSNSNSSSGGKMSFFKVLTRRNSTANQGKHKKMTEKWMEGGEPVTDGVAFCVKFLGSTLIEKAGPGEAAEATKTVIQMMKAGHKPTRLGLNVSTNGITLSDPSTGEIRLEISIYDIAHCCTDSSHPSVFSFIATSNVNDVNECYCFATRKRKMAQHITLTIAQAFNVAFEMWQNSGMENCGASSVPNDVVEVIVGSTESGKSNGSTGSDAFRDWVAFDQDQNDQEKLANHFNDISLVTLSPFHRLGNQPSRRLRQPPQKPSDDLLICLN